MAQEQATRYQSNANQCYKDILKAIKKAYPFTVPKSLKNTVWNDIKHLRVSKVHQRYIQPKYATALYIRHIIRNSYRYNQDSTQYKLVGRIQPEVNTLINHELFKIRTPYKVGQQPLVFYLVWVHHQEWQLLVHRVLPHNKQKAVIHESIQFQIGQISPNWFYIPVETQSLQNAYYRLINFSLDLD